MIAISRRHKRHLRCPYIREADARFFVPFFTTKSRRTRSGASLCEILRASRFDWVTKRPPEADFTKKSQSARRSESASGGPRDPRNVMHQLRLRSPCELFAREFERLQFNRTALSFLFFVLLVVLRESASGGPRDPSKRNHCLVTVTCR